MYTTINKFVNYNIYNNLLKINILHTHFRVSIIIPSRYTVDNLYMQFYLFLHLTILKTTKIIL